MRQVLIFAVLLIAVAPSARADPAAGYRAFEAGDYAVAMTALLAPARQGDPRAEHVIGEIYAEGLGVAQDYVSAAQWYKRSAEQDYAPAMADLGDLYFYGHGVVQDLKTAAKWYRRGANLGDPYGEYDYGLIFHDGSAGEKQDFDVAMKWFLRAAAQGAVEALNMVGYMHDNGEGVPANAREAIRWYKRAAENGFDIAQFNLGVMYQSGRGTDKDPAEAARWYRAAADQGDPDSQAALGFLYEQGLGVAADINEAIALYIKSARQGCSRALINLGVLYHDGDGVPRDVVTAYALYALAADRAVDEDDRKLAAENRDDLADELSGGDLAKAKELHKAAMTKLDLVLPAGLPTAGHAQNGGAKAAAAPAQPSGSGGLVGNVKAALIALGYDPGGRDNTLGDKTIDAIRSFQRDRGLPATGEISNDLLSALLAARFDVASTGKISQSDPGAAPLQLYATGSGFYVTASGLLVTSQHVVDGCRQMRLADGAALQLVIADRTNDLALLQSPHQAPGFARFRDGHGVRTGEAILVAGFPLRDEISSELNVTTGNVSALAGPDNDRSLIQITAPVQHGNSGGPVLDLAGNVIGVVQSKFDPTTEADDDETIDVPQNVNFAISANTLRAFLDAQDIDYDSGVSTSTLSSAEIARRARDFTVSLECWQ